MMNKKVDLQFGETISDLHDKFGEFSTATSLKLSYLSIECIEEIHKIGFIHRGRIVILTLFLLSSLLFPVILFYDKLKKISLI